MSILIPTHNRPDYLTQALTSAVNQTYKNIEIVISDNSDTSESRDRIESLINSDKRIHYIRNPGASAIQNFQKCRDNATGDFVNYLMDDDLFHPEKIERMVKIYISNPEVGLVTSFRTLIDENGNELPPDSRNNETLAPKDCLIDGSELSEFLLRKGKNLIGEPTTVLLPRDIALNFGNYLTADYNVLSDVATWLSALSSGKRCAYIAEPLSYFRIHAGQAQKLIEHAIDAQIEWMRLVLCSVQARHLFAGSTMIGRAIVAEKLGALTSFAASCDPQALFSARQRADIRSTVAESIGFLTGPI